MTGDESHKVMVAGRGGPEVLTYTAVELAEPGPGEVRIRSEACGVSAYDAMLRQYAFPGAPKPPYAPGEDVVGVVDAVGDRVVAPVVGDRVAAWTFGDAGCYAEHVVVDAERAVPVPGDLDAPDAVALVVNYLTAHAAMHAAAGVENGERVLIHGAAGGVGSALVQLGAVAGLEMYGTASGHNQEIVAELGAIPIDYRNEDFVARIRELTGDGVDVVFDVIGGGRQMWRSARCLRKGGRLLLLGMAAANRKGRGVIPGSLLVVGLVNVLPNGKRSPGMPSLDKHAADNMDWYRNTLAEMFELASSGKMKPLVADRIPLAEAGRAHELMAAGGYAGKIVLMAGD
ncbi:MAG: zinc-binding dehydrogenase [Acidimicrobiia bacterium]|nr:zinc-binding dehydrogenase [Acidimicrobiia bacterium]